LLFSEQRPDLEAITVHSCPWAVGVYERLGFVPLGPEQEQDGIRFVEMVRAS
jgi:predicted GNAT family N-acyltransferase